jgi:hypothetical protein
MTIKDDVSASGQYYHKRLMVLGKNKKITKIFWENMVVLVQVKLTSVGVAHAKLGTFQSVHKQKSIGK